MRRTLAPLFVLLLSLALAGCQGSRLRPGADAALGWSSTPQLTGPAAKLGLGEYEFGGFGSPDGDATPAPSTPAQPDPALAALTKSLEEKSAAWESRLKDLETKAASAQAASADLQGRVARGELTPDQAAALKKAADDSAAALAAGKDFDARLTTTKAAADKATQDYLALKGQLEQAERSNAMPSWIPKDWTIPGLITFGLAWVAWFMRKRGIDDLRARVAAALKAAITHTNEAVRTFDDLPESVDSVAVQNSLEAKAAKVDVAAIAGTRG